MPDFLTTDYRVWIVHLCSEVASASTHVRLSTAHLRFVSSRANPRNQVLTVTLLCRARSCCDLSAGCPNMMCATHCRSSGTRPCPVQKHNQNCGVVRKFACTCCTELLETPDDARRMNQ